MYTIQIVCNLVRISANSSRRRKIIGQIKDFIKKVERLNFLEKLKEKNRDKKKEALKQYGYTCHLKQTE